MGAVRHGPLIPSSVGDVGGSKNEGNRRACITETAAAAADDSDDGARFGLNPGCV